MSTRIRKLDGRFFLMGEEFTKTDKIIYLLNYAWTGLWTIVFIVEQYIIFLMMSAIHPG